MFVLFDHHFPISLTPTFLPLSSFCFSFFLSLFLSFISRALISSLFFFLNLAFLPLLCPLKLEEHWVIASHRQLASIPNHLTEAPIPFENRDYLSFAGSTRKTNYTQAIFLSTLTSNLLPLPCFLTSPLRDVIVQHLSASKKSFFFFFFCVKPISLSYISASARRVPPSPRPPPKISESLCLSLLAIKQQIPAF